MNIFKESKRVRLVKAYRELFHSKVGEEVLHDLCKSCHVYTSTMDSNPQEMAYKEGARSVVLRILKTIEIDPFELDRQLKKGQSNEE
jgi:hypothetical protein